MSIWRHDACLLGALFGAYPMRGSDSVIISCLHSFFVAYPRHHCRLLEEGAVAVLGSQSVAGEVDPHDPSRLPTRHRQQGLRVCAGEPHENYRARHLGLSVPWSLRPQNRAAAASAAVVAASIAAATETCGNVFFCWVCDWYAGSPIGQCDGVQGCFEHGAQLLKALAPWLKNRTRLASFWRFSGDFSAAADPKLTCLRRGSVLSFLRCVFAQAFAINPLGNCPKLP